MLMASMNRKGSVLSAAAVLLVASMQARALDLRGTPWETVAARQGLDAGLLYAIAVQETQRPNGKGAVAPWPWTLGVKGQQRFHASAENAGTALPAMLRESEDVRIGLFQISLKDHGDRFGDPATLLDAEVNLAVAAGILADGIRSAGDDLALGIGRYRHPHDDRAARAYGRRVLALSERLRGRSTRAQRVIDLWRTAAVLDLVAGPESRGNYNAWYRAAHQGEVQLAELTLAEVRALQRRLVRQNGGSAIGRYQIIDDTLDGLVVRMGLSTSERFTPALQDRMAMHLAREAGLAAWLDGALSDERFAARLARVWAGLPADQSGRSRYAGIQGNRAGIGWRALVRSLGRIRSESMIQ
jgi:hypothetical protein